MESKDNKNTKGQDTEKDQKPTRGTVLLMATSILFILSTVVYLTVFFTPSGIRVIEGKAPSKKLNYTSVVKPDTNNLAQPVDINTADVEELEKLPGIGPVKALEIVKYRSAHGFFKNPAELKNVKGISEKTFQKLKKHVTAR